MINFIPITVAIFWFISNSHEEPISPNLNKKLMSEKEYEKLTTDLVKEAETILEDAKNGRHEASIEEFEMNAVILEAKQAIGEFFFIRIIMISCSLLIYSFAKSH